MAVVGGLDTAGTVGEIKPGAAEAASGICVAGDSRVSSVATGPDVSLATNPGVAVGRGVEVGIGVAVDSMKEKLKPAVEVSRG